MKRTIVIVLSMLTVTVQAQIIENDSLPMIKDSLEFKLNSEALRDLQRSFEFLSPSISKSQNGLKFNPQDYPEIKTKKIFYCPTSLLNNTKMGLPRYEQIRIGRFLFQAQTNYNSSPYLLQKRLSLSFPLNDHTAFYLKGDFDWMRQRPVYMSGLIQPISIKTGLSFHLKGGQIIELGIKYQYTAGEKWLDVYRQWDTSADCTLYF